MGGCGLIGGLTGGGIAAGALPVVHHVGLMWIVSEAPRRRHRADGVDRQAPCATPPRRRRAKISHLTWEIIRKSGYIKILTVGLALSVVVGTLVDFEFKLLVQRMYPEPHQLTRFLGAFYAGLNGVSLLFQFGAAGWLLQRLGLGAATALQPGAVLVFAAWAAMTTGGWVVVGMRWIQGVISQTLGKSSTEIYYAAIDPKERRRIKPALDTLVERWSDALVGIVLIVVLRLLRVPVATITIVTGALAALWLIVLFVLNRQYGRAFHEALSRRWIESRRGSRVHASPLVAESAPLSSRPTTSARSSWPSSSASMRADAATAQAVRGCLVHRSPQVQGRRRERDDRDGAPDRERVISGFLAEPHEGLRRAAVRYLLSRREQPIDFARRVLDGDDPALTGAPPRGAPRSPVRRRAACSDGTGSRRAWRPARAMISFCARPRTPAQWTTRRPRNASKPLLTNPDVEIQRVALRSAARRPNRDLLDVLLPLPGRLRAELRSTRGGGGGRRTGGARAGTPAERRKRRACPDACRARIDADREPARLGEPHDAGPRRRREAALPRAPGDGARATPNRPAGPAAHRRCTGCSSASCATTAPGMEPVAVARDKRIAGGAASRGELSRIRRKGARAFSPGPRVLVRPQAADRRVRPAQVPRSVRRLARIGVSWPRAPS